MSIHISKIVVLLMLTGSAFGQQPTLPKQDIRTIQHDEGVSKRGDVTIFDMNTIQVGPDGSILVLTSSGPPNTGFWDGIVIGMYFDCYGHVAFMDPGETPKKWESMRPISVAGRIAEMVCRKEPAQ